MPQIPYSRENNSNYFGVVSLETIVYIYIRAICIYRYR